MGHIFSFIIFDVVVVVNTVIFVVGLNVELTSFLKFI